MDGLVIIPCGASKLTTRAPARHLYTGAYFTACKRAAEALQPSRGWYILSAKHGLLHPDTELNPYDLRMGQHGSVSPATIRRQAATLGLTNIPTVVVLAGRDYAAVARRVWPHATLPLQAVRGGMGHQMRCLAHIREAGTLPTTTRQHA